MHLLKALNILTVLIINQESVRDLVYYIIIVKFVKTVLENLEEFYQL